MVLSNKIFYPKLPKDIITYDDNNEIMTIFVSNSPYIINDGFDTIKELNVIGDIIINGGFNNLETLIVQNCSNYYVEINVQLPKLKTLDISGCYKFKSICNNNIECLTYHSNCIENLNETFPNLLCLSTDTLTIKNQKIPLSVRNLIIDVFDDFYISNIYDAKNSELRNIIMNNNNGYTVEVNLSNLQFFYYSTYNGYIKGNIENVNELILDNGMEDDEDFDLIPKMILKDLKIKNINKLKLLNISIK